MLERSDMILRWNKTDLAKYLTAKEYIDTLIVPLIPFSFSEENHFEKSAFLKEVLTLFSFEIEKELHGRVLLSPEYNYLKFNDKEEEIKRLNKWVDDAKTQPFSHIFFVTFDATWKKYEQQLEGNLLWLPGIPTGDMKSKEMRMIIVGQVEQISELIRSYWT